MAAAQQPPHHVRAHPAETDHTHLHFACSSSDRIGACEPSRFVRRVQLPPALKTR
jgi:hypothetical protein